MEISKKEAEKKAKKMTKAQELCSYAMPPTEYYILDDECAFTLETVRARHALWTQKPPRCARRT